MSRSPRHSGGKSAAGVRIIGGTMRSRKVHFAAAEGLRPSPDRVRETLFNWLQPVIGGARCLDLFAGSGVLGFEALSRGAASVLLVESNTRTVSCLREQIGLLGVGEQCQLREADVLQWLQGQPEQPYDIVFLDPPYRQALLGQCCELLQQGGWVQPGSRIYLEAERELGEPLLPAGWTLLRSKHAGQTGYFLAQS